MTDMTDEEILAMAKSIEHRVFNKSVSFEMNWFRDDRGQATFQGFTWPQACGKQVVEDYCKSAHERADHVGPTKEQIMSDPRVQALVDALEWYLSNDDTNTGDEPMQEYNGRSWDEMNEYWIQGNNRAISAIAQLKTGYDIPTDTPTTGGNDE
jgi:hypothetical protein